MQSLYTVLSTQYRQTKPGGKRGQELPGFEGQEGWEWRGQEGWDWRVKRDDWIEGSVGMVGLE